MYAINVDLRIYLKIVLQITHTKAMYVENFVSNVIPVKLASKSIR